MKVHIVGPDDFGVLEGITKYMADNQISITDVSSEVVPGSHIGCSFQCNWFCCLHSEL